MAEQTLGEGRGTAGVPGLPGQLLLGRHLPPGGIGEETPLQAGPAPKDVKMERQNGIMSSLVTL